MGQRVAERQFAAVVGFAFAVGWIQFGLVRAVGCIAAAAGLYALVVLGQRGVLERAARAALAWSLDAIRKLQQAAPDPRPVRPQRPARRAEPAIPDEERTAERPRYGW